VVGPLGMVLIRKLRRVNESVDGYEPGGRRFESCWAHFEESIIDSFRGFQFFGDCVRFCAYILRALRGGVERGHCLTMRGVADVAVALRHLRRGTRTPA
jgi:hypothetical protein